MQIASRDDYIAARAQLDLLDVLIDDSPSEHKLVFRGIVELHSAVRRYEAENDILDEAEHEHG